MVIPIDNRTLDAAERLLSDARRLAELAAGNPNSVFAVMAANALSGARLLTDAARSAA